MDSDTLHNKPAGEGGFIDTIQSLIVAFVLAMTFRGFVVEGFVIPTGSMAPTLLGQHLLVRSPQTGYEAPVGLDSSKRPNTGMLQDPPLGRGHALDRAGALARRLGDRILVVKYLWPFFQPDRYDVAVFKNPTEPEGPSANYIKRVYGLPGETVWIVDGDIFIRPPGGDSFQVQRKPMHVQRSTWQEVWDSDMVPQDPTALSKRWSGPPWIPSPATGWKSEDARTYDCTVSDPVELKWDTHRYPLDDWTDYNMLAQTSQRYLQPVRDLRITGAITPLEPGLVTSLDILADSHVFRYSIDGSTANVSMWLATDPTAKVTRSAEIEPLAPGHGTAVQFQRIDQSMSITINGKAVVELFYDWSPRARLANAMGSPSSEASAAELGRQKPASASLLWKFSGSPFSITNMSMARDIHYRHGLLNSRSMKNGPAAGYEKHVVPGSPGYGTHPDKLGVLGDDQYFVLGDNTARSLDSRYWGPPHAYVAEQIDAMPFVVNRKLFIGKAWVVYYPAPHALKSGGMGLIPDFGRIRLIH